MNRLSFSLAACVLSLGLASCSIGFNRDWQDAAQAAPSRSPKDLSGAWQGTWRSEQNGHEGQLRAIVSVKDAKAGVYAFRYHATYGKIFSATYEADHMATRRGGSYTLTGEKDLGHMVGVYHFTGTATPTNFKASYKSSDDHGVFLMSRP